MGMVIEFLVMILIDASSLGDAIKIAFSSDLVLPETKTSLAVAFLIKHRHLF